MLALSLRETETDELLRLTFEMFAARAARVRIDLRVEPSEHATIVVDPDHVLRILGNLVTNALQATPEGGTVVIGAHAGPGDAIRFTVHDTGPGIAAGQQAQLFDAYRQGSGTNRGSLGLGLHISQALAKAHGGTVGVDSEPRRGSTFWVQLPRRAAAPDGHVS